MKGLITYFIKYPVPGNLLMIIILIFGFFGLKSIKSTFFPQSESRIIQIQSVYPGASPEEIEEGIITKIEDNLKGVTGIIEITSISSENSGVITLEGERGYDVDYLLQDVKNAVDQISSFPLGMEPVVVFKQEAKNFVISFALTGDVDLGTLKDKGRMAEDELRAMDGLSKVTLSGFPDEEIEIALDPAALEAFNLTFEAVSQAVAQSNIEITGGTIKGPREELLIRARSKSYRAFELENIIVKATTDGMVVRLGEVAELKDRWADLPQRNYFNGNPSVTLTVQNTNDEDFLAIQEKVKEYIIDFNAKNDVVQAAIIRDASLTLIERIALLTSNGLLGFILVIIILALVLNVRLAFWVALSIPIAFAGMFILGSSFGLTINVLSLFGMILVIGILVDDGIVIGENIYQHYERGETALQAALKGTLEVLPAVTSAVLTTIVAFGTFYFLDGRLGDFGPDLAFVVIATLLFSLVEGLLILPGHIAHSKALSGKVKKSKLVRGSERVMNYLKNKVYSPALHFSIHNPLLAIAIPIAMFMITIGGFKGGIIQTTFFPTIEQDNIGITIEMPPGTRDVITEGVLDYLVESAYKVNADLKADRADGEDVVINIEKIVGPNTNQGSINIQLLNSEQRAMSVFDINQALRNEVGVIPEIDKMLFGVATPFGKPFSVSMRSNNLEQLQGAKDVLKKELDNIADLSDVSDNDQRGIKEINIELKDKAYLLGLNLQQVLGQVRQGFFGAEAQRLQRGIDEVKVWVRFAEEERASTEDLGDFLIRTPSGQKIPLKELADYEIDRGVIAINHLNGKREIRVEAELGNPEASVSAIQEDITNTIMPVILNQYPAVQYSFEGQNKEANKTKVSFAKVGPIILLLMIFIIAFTFRSVPQALSVIILIPLGIVGVGWGHWIHSSALSLLSGFGVIALIGVMVNDSLVLITALNSNLKKGLDFKTSLYEAGLSRFRPIIMTSFTTVAGLAPLIFEKSFQAQFLVPMAIAIAYGLIMATYTTLLVLPVVLNIINTMRVYLTWLWTGEKPERHEVEPAFKELKYENEI